jgi:hypothetical protein
MPRPRASTATRRGLAGLAIPLFFYVYAMGFIIANTISGALAGMFAEGTPSSMGFVIAVCALGGVLCTVPLRATPRSRQNDPDEVCPN